VNTGMHLLQYPFCLPPGAVLFLPSCLFLDLCFCAIIKAQPRAVHGLLNPESSNYLYGPCGITRSDPATVKADGK
jgi:hypothetical protein